MLAIVVEANSEEEYEDIPRVAGKGLVYCMSLGLRDSSTD